MNSQVPPLDLTELRQKILSLEPNPVARTHPRNWLFRAKRMLDLVGHARRPMSSFFRKINPYPKPFEHHFIAAEDGVRIALWYGPPHPDGPTQAVDLEAEEVGDEEPRNLFSRVRAAWDSWLASPDEAQAETTDPSAMGRTDPPPARPAFGLVIVPGMFSTKDDTVHKRRTIRIWRAWKIPIVCVDTRAFGESDGISTGGWKEALDVHAAAKFLRDVAGVRRVAVLAESLGGASALNALALDHESGTDLLTGGVLCWSAFMDLKDAVHYISSEPPKTHPFYPQWLAFRRLLSFRTHGGYERFDEYMDDAARVNGLQDFNELVDIANPKWKTSMMKQPTLLIHATDDPVVPVRHARRMERYAMDHPHIQVVTVPFGGHTGFEAMDPLWFWDIMRRFFGAVNGVELANLADPKPFNPSGSEKPKE